MTDIGPLDVGRHVEALTALGPRDPESGSAVAGALRYLTDQLKGFGYEVSVERYGGDLHEVNLLAEVPGTESAASLLEVGAHWDTVPGSPGADDNASGVAGVLEVARVLSTGGVRPRTGVRFCLFGGEEDGLQGSTAHVERAGDSIAGAVILEMIGYRSAQPGSQRVPENLARLVEAPSAGDFIAVIADPASAPYAAAFAEVAAPQLAVFTLTAPGPVFADLYRSDHVPYWRAGRPALQLTDTAEFRNPHYHRPSDTVDTLDLEFAAAVAQAVAATAVRLAA
jgi:Zn-dependent M28 family amino/carboxypeptidase